MKLRVALAAAGVVSTAFERCKTVLPAVHETPRHFYIRGSADMDQKVRIALAAVHCYIRGAANMNHKVRIALATNHTMLHSPGFDRILLATTQCTSVSSGDGPLTSTSTRPLAEGDDQSRTLHGE